MERSDCAIEGLIIFGFLGYSIGGVLGLRFPFVAVLFILGGVFGAIFGAIYFYKWFH